MHSCATSAQVNHRARRTRPDVRRPLREVDAAPPTAHELCVLPNVLCRDANDHRSPTRCHRRRGWPVHTNRRAPRASRHASRTAPLAKPLPPPSHRLPPLPQESRSRTLSTRTTSRRRSRREEATRGLGRPASCDGWGSEAAVDSATPQWSGFRVRRRRWWRPDGSRRIALRALRAGCGMRGSDGHRSVVGPL